MQMLVLVLNNESYLEDLLNELEKKGIKGATIIDSTGMGRVLHSNDDIPIFGGIKFLMNDKRPFNKTIFTVIKDNQVEIATKAVKDVVGDLNEPGTGILFTVPVSYCEGINI